MKYFSKLAFVSLFTLGFTSCSGDSGKFDLLDFLYSSNSRESYEEKKARLAEPFIGSYTCTDALGFTFTLDIKQSANYRFSFCITNYSKIIFSHFFSNNIGLHYFVKIIF